MRYCSYCPEDQNTAEIKECVEGMYKTIYKLQAEKNELLKDLIQLRTAYKEATGEDYIEKE